MKISDKCLFSQDAELLKAEWYYSRKLQEAKTEDEAKAYVLFWHCSNELIKMKWRDHERSLGHGRGKENSKEVLQR